ncbi:unconventional myosin-Ih [Protopterus annectens]|uniref:unconventional myosin-Ih n=1 Tax=Protopterus annectens TaxID=7888 RepID=UPI001CF9B753|nr:unconventional myosin-Ih [Protopterus annectens]
MEGALTIREKVGIQDFVLLDSFTSEDAFLDNLRKRFRENIIYTYIGNLLVSVNPYKDLDIYNTYQMELYQGMNLFELPPHIYAIADNAYRVMCGECSNQFILISGESGSGKTETSKKILQYYAFTCPITEQLEMIRDRLLLSNPVLEGFGNAKTLRNDNSSRFGKYMDIQFNFEGAPVGGHIISYLLEKSRVVHQNHGERNFHIFYQLVEGGEDELLQSLGLECNSEHYYYLVQGECAKVTSINDKSDWKTVRKAFSVTEFDENDTEHLLGIIASVLHLGNIEYREDEKGNAIITNDTHVRWLSKLLGVPLAVLEEALICRKIDARTEEVLSPLSIDMSMYVRDALAKAIYGRTFTWLVNIINNSLANKDPSRKTVIGLLDIYGFEVFEMNSFEQFCINYCNEKLHQLLIELTLKSEQEEYQMEGIKWEPVHYFDNKSICDLIEERHRGIISILDEECMRPGDATDLTFLDKLEEKLGYHPHIVTQKFADQKVRKNMERADFKILHYAGEVTYNVLGFLDKNNDLLFRHIKELMCNAKNHIIKQCFFTSELDNRKRPETVATQFKNSLAGLLDILTSKVPSYIRCIKPNDDKEPGKFNDMLVKHQVKYLGLMEHLQVRRAGFAYRRKYEPFLQRYKSLCPDTWPHWNGPTPEGVERLLKHLGNTSEDYKLGRTKIFIRFPKTLFAIEDAFQLRKHELVTAIQARYKGCRGRRDFLKQKNAAVKIEAGFRGILARKEAKRRAWAIEIVKKFIRGFIYRNQPLCPENAEFVIFVRHNYLTRLRNNLPKNVLDKIWLKPPTIAIETSEMLQKLCQRNMVRKYVRGITPQRKAQLQQKLIASEIFKGKKEGYVQSVARPFADTRLSEQDVNVKVMQLIRNIKYGVPVIKIDRNGFKQRQRQLILTQTTAYIVEEAKIKQKIEYATLKGISVSSLSDGILVIHVPCEDNKQKGDAILLCEHIFETAIKLCTLAKKQNALKIVQGSLQFTIHPGTEGTIDFSTGQQPQIYKAKNGHLMVVSPRMKSR